MLINLVSTFFLLNIRDYKNTSENFVHMKSGKWSSHVDLLKYPQCTTKDGRKPGIRSGNSRTYVSNYKLRLSAIFKCYNSHRALFYFWEVRRIWGA